MITQNVQTKLPGSVLGYKLLQTIVGSIIVAVIAYFAPQVASYRLVLIPAIFVIGVVYAYLSWMVYSYIVTVDAISVTSGVFFRSTKTIPFHDLQSADVRVGPLLMMFGLGRFVGFTASPAQFIVQTTQTRNGPVTSTTQRPDVDLIVPKVDADQIAAMARTGDIQKVQAVQM